MAWSSKFIAILIVLFFFVSCKKDPVGPGVVKEFGLEFAFYFFPASHGMYYGSFLWPDDEWAFWYGDHGLYRISVPNGNAQNIDQQPGYFAALESNSETIYYLPAECLAGCSAPVHRVPVAGGTTERFSDIEVQVGGSNPVLPISPNQFLYVLLPEGSSTVFTYLYDHVTGDTTRLAAGLPETLSPDRSEILVYQPDETVYTEEEEIQQLAFVSLDGGITNTWQLSVNQFTHSPVYQPVWDDRGIRMLYMKRDYEDNAEMSLWFVRFPDSQEEKLWDTSAGPEKTIQGPFRWSEDKTLLSFWERHCLEADLFSCKGGYQWTLWVYNAINGEATRQVVKNTDDGNPARDQQFSSSGTQLLILYGQSLYLQDVK